MGDPQLEYTTSVVEGDDIELVEVEVGDPRGLGEFIFAATKKKARASLRQRSPGKRPVVSELAGAKLKLFSAESGMVKGKVKKQSYKMILPGGSPGKKHKGGVRIEELEHDGMEGGNVMQLSTESGSISHLCRDQ